MKVDVTQADKDAGKRGCSRSCPIAIAVKRAAGCNRVVVTIGECHVYGPDSVARSYRMPREASDFVKRYDLGGDTAPFSFELSEEVDEPRDEPGHWEPLEPGQCEFSA